MRYVILNFCPLFERKIVLAPLNVSIGFVPLNALYKLFILDTF